MVKTDTKPVGCKSCRFYDCKWLNPTYTQRADVLFVGGYPVSSDIVKGAFSGRNSGLLRSVSSRLKAEKAEWQRLVFNYDYVCRCSPPFNEVTKKYDINAEIFQKCQTGLLTSIDRFRPKTIVALGADALKALGLKGKPSDYRGGIYTFKTSDGVDIPVVATFHIVAVSKQPGYLNTFQKDLRKAFTLARGEYQAGEARIELPKTADEIIATLDDAISTVDSVYKNDGRRQAVAVDTETTSLKPYRLDERVIAVSLSYKENHCVAFPFEHRDNPFSDEDLEKIKSKLSELLSHPGAYMVMANGKFDIQWLKYHYGITMNSLDNDVMLAEHSLDEDKKGEYSLKDITRDRFPALGKYEEELKNYRDAVWRDKDEAVEKLREVHKDTCNELIFEYWLNLDIASRKALCASWVERGFIDFTDAAPLLEVKQRKLKGELVIPKKYQDSVLKLASRVPKEEFPNLPEFKVPDALLSKTYEDISLDILLNYAALDALTTRLIVASQRDDFARDDRRIDAIRERAVDFPVETRPCRAVFFDNTVPLSEALSDMEYNGVKLDRDRCLEYKRVCEEKLSELKDKLFTEVGRQFSTSASSPDLGNILFNEMKLPVKKVTDTGNPCTDADTLKELSDEYDLPFLRDLRAYRKIEKCLSTYLVNWLKSTEYDGKIHCNFNQTGTSTYRLSSSNPNLQNTPFALKEANLNLKSLFIPDSDEFDIYDLDISNAEMRVLTAYSKDEALIDAFNHGKDLHCLTGAGISCFTYEDLKANKENKETQQYTIRQLSKRINFGVIYCISPAGLKAQLWSQLRLNETEEQCQEYMNKFFETYPGVKTYIEITKRIVSECGLTWTFTGRRRRFDIARLSSAHTNRVSRQAVNARIQTTSSDLVMYNLIDLHKWLKSLGGRVLLTVHDSIVFQLPKNVGSVKDEIRNIITVKTSERAPWLPVEWKYDVGRGDNYGDTHGEVV